MHASQLKNINTNVDPERRINDAVASQNTFVARTQELKVLIMTTFSQHIWTHNPIISETERKKFSLYLLVRNLFYTTYRPSKTIYNIIFKPTGGYRH